MKRRRLLGVLGVGVVAELSGNRPGESAQMSLLAVRVVPTSYREKTGRAIELYRPSQHFHVVVTNVSDEPIRLWREWCSWGYFNLSFEVTNGDGRPIAVRKRDRAWDKNYPDWEIIPPGGHQVWDVTFDPTTWKDSPLPETPGSRAVSMRAIYGIRPDKETKEYGIWTGQVSSPEESYKLWK
jgi:hypothetical protein